VTPTIVRRLIVDDLDTLRDLFPPESRVARGFQEGTVDEVGVIRGHGIAYVTWDRTPADDPDTPARREAVLVEYLRRVD